MTYATLMVCLQLDRSNAGLLEIAGSLAQRFDAGVIGIATCPPPQSMFNTVYVPADLIELDREEINKRIENAEAEFRTALGARVKNIRWRPMMMFGPLSECVATEARNADLVLANVDRGASSFDPSRDVNVGDLVMQVGRPVLVVPAALDKLRMERAIVGWNDTRESRRAIVDALPFLEQAAHVTVAEIADGSELAEVRLRLEDVVEWLKRHGVAARCIAAPSSGDDASRLNAIVEEQGADLIVGAAYGHSRLREWVFGGVTKDLLLNADVCSLVSH